MIRRNNSAAAASIDRIVFLSPFITVRSTLLSVMSGSLPPTPPRPPNSTHGFCRAERCSIRTTFIRHLLLCCAACSLFTQRLETLPIYSADSLPSDDFGLRTPVLMWTWYGGVYTKMAFRLPATDPVGGFQVCRGRWSYLPSRSPCSIFFLYNSICNNARAASTLVGISL